MSNPSITVIIPAYNVERFVEETIESVLSQQSRANEIIVIDDGSTDSTWSIIKKYANESGFKCLQTINRGPGPTRNLGLALASSEYIYFLDGDDKIRPELFKAARDAIVNHEADLFLFSGESFCDEEHDCTNLPRYERNICGVFHQSDNFITKLWEKGALFPSPCHYVSKRDIWAKHRLQFPAVIHEDRAIFLPLLAFNQTIYVDTATYYLRRVRPNSIMTSPIGKENIKGVLHVLTSTMEFIAQNPDLVKKEIRVWRWQVRSCGFDYLSLCKHLKQKPAFAPLLSSVICVSSLNYSIHLAIYALPRPIKEVLRLPKRVTMFLLRRLHSLLCGASVPCFL